MQKKLEYLEKMRMSLVDEENKEFLIKMVQARKNVKKYLIEKDLQKVMTGNILKQNLMILTHFFKS